MSRIPESLIGVQTPWGSTREAQDWRLPPGPSTDSELVRLNQRERLLMATIAAVNEYGYEQTRVADILAGAGVSRSAFYRHFDNKCDCYVAAVDALLEYAVEAVAGEERDAMLAALVCLVVEQPASARLCLIETYAAGPDALDRVAGALDAVRRGFGELPAAIVAGALRTMASRANGDPRMDEAIARELIQWGRGYDLPELPRPRRKPLADMPERPSEDAMDRILDAIVSIVAVKGYHATSITEVVGAASMSLTTFYKWFPGEASDSGYADEEGDDITPKLQAFLAAVKRAELDVLSGIRERPESERMDLLLGRLAGRPDLARLLVIEQHAAAPGRPPIFAATLDHAPLVAEAIGWAVHSLVERYVHRSHEHRLRELAPTAAYLAAA